MEIMNNFVISVNWQQIFQRVPGLWMILAVLLAIFGPIYLPIFYSVYYLFLHIILFVNNARYALAVGVFYYRSVEHATTDWVHKYCMKTTSFSTSDPVHDLPFDHVVHLIIIPNYKESESILREALDVLKSHDIATTQYRICLAMEESEENALDKARDLEMIYMDDFLDITHTLHPCGLAGEIRGKGSNVAWAALQMASDLHSSHSHEIVTIMDVDNCFAQDYFYGLNYYYSTATPEERKIMMFIPGCVFDRNANDVPAFVRVVDFGWSIGSMSNLYQSSPIKLPLSSYSISMDLCILVNFWDTGPEAIGEDCHMYLKCFFSTQGKLITRTIFSPISVCNVQSSESGLLGYFTGLKARYVQGKRHLWASLDTGYMLRRTLLGIAAPEYDASINGGIIHDKFTPQSETEAVPFSKLVNLYHRILEAHTFMCQIFVFILFSKIIAPGSSGLIWNYLAGGNINLHPYVSLAMTIGGIIQTAVLIPNGVTGFYYHRYHKFVGFERWALQDSHLLKQSLGPNYSAPEFSLRNVSRNHRHLKVHRLVSSVIIIAKGKRPVLHAKQDRVKFVLEFASSSIISAAMFYLIPQLHAQISHLYTNELVYQVAEKPEGGEDPSHFCANSSGASTAFASDDEIDCLTSFSSGGKSDEGYFGSDRSSNFGSS